MQLTLSFVIASNYRKFAPKLSPHKGTSTFKKGNSNNAKTVDYKVTSILCQGEVTTYTVKDLKMGRVAWIGEDQLELCKMEGYVGVYDKIDSNGNPIPRIPGKDYNQQVVVYHTPKYGDDDDDDDDEESDIDPVIDGKAKDVARSMESAMQRITRISQKHLMERSTKRLIGTARTKMLNTRYWRMLLVRMRHMMQWPSCTVVTLMKILSLVKLQKRSSLCISMLMKMWNVSSKNWSAVIVILITKTKKVMGISIYLCSMLVFR